MKSTLRTLSKIGFFFCAVSILFGAFGTHILKDYITESSLRTFETGVKYQFIHSIALAILPLMYRKIREKVLLRSSIFFILGIILFSGSLYLLATMSIWGNEDFIWIGAITPVGGVCLVGAWLLLSFYGVRPVEELPSGHFSGNRNDNGSKPSRHTIKESEKEKV